MKIVVEKDLGSFSISDYIKKNNKKINKNENFIDKEDKTENSFLSKTTIDSNSKQKILLQKMMHINQIENYKSIQFLCNKYPFRIILKDKIYFDFLDFKINEKLKILIEEDINCGLKYLKMIKIISSGNFNDIEKIFNNH